MNNTRLILMRHGETDWNVEERIQGCQDIPLNEVGIRQVEESSRLFLNHSTSKFCRIVSSPLLRAKQSAEICSRILNIPIEWMPEFSERRFGELEGKTREEIQAQYKISDIEEFAEASFGVESISSFWERVRGGLLQVVTKYDQLPILLVTHGSVIKLIAKQYGIEIGIIRNAAFLEIEPKLQNSRL